jgi:hypothetical protein
MSDSLKLQTRLADVLSEIRKRAGLQFSGIGIIVSDYPNGLPLFPIGQPTKIVVSDTISYLVDISNPESGYHDGFHVVSAKFHIELISQYFSPPIVTSAFIDRRKRFGGRYLAALFGSAIPEVYLTGIASKNFGSAVFEKGKEVSYEAPR